MSRPLAKSHIGLLFTALLCSDLQAAPPELRVASFNVSLSPNSATSLGTTLADPSSTNPKKIAEIVQRVAPDVLFLNELNYDGTSSNLDALHDNFIAVSQNGHPAQSYPHRFVAECNTGIHSGLDFDNSGSTNSNPGSDVYGNDCFGFGRFPGQFAMAVLSKYPIRTDEIRTLQKFLWDDMPGALLPTIGGVSWYNVPELAVFRLSSKSHWDIPIDVDGHVVHLLGSHPTPPTFDGVENRNGKRNHDEIRLWADYIDPARDSYIYDDDGVMRGLGAGKRFVICGDQNADPVDGDSVSGAAQQLTEHALINASLVPSSSGGGTDSATFSGGLRVDYVLPSKDGLVVDGGGVFWPASGEAGQSLISVSDHRLVWMNLSLLPIASEAVPDLAIAVEGEDVVLSWSAAPGVSYEIESTTTGGSWSVDEAITVSVEGAVAIARDVGAATGGGVKLYRVGARFE